MRRSGLVLVVISILLLSSYAQAEDFVRLGSVWPYGHELCQNYRQAELPFYITVESADTAVIATGSNGFVISTTGLMTFEFVEIKFGPQFEDIGYTVLQDVDSIAPDTVVVGFFDAGGLPVLIEEPYFTLVIDVGLGFGWDICIDSTFVPPSLPWKWSGPDVEIIPSFVDDDGSSSPFCMPVIELTCGSPVVTVQPPDSGLHGYTDCGDISFEFVAGRGSDGPTFFRVLAGPGTIEASSCTTAVYTCPVLETGSYPVLVEAEFCCMYVDCVFDVVFHDEERPLGDCNCDSAVDIDDVVYLIAYIFSGGYTPHANPDCTGQVDIDDVVYLIAFIFSGGPAPCG